MDAKSAAKLPFFLGF